MTIKSATERNSFAPDFSDPEMLARYAEGHARRFVPGLDDMHRMTGLLLAEHAPYDADVLVLGAGGGMELKALANAQPGWTFVGVDPAKPMLDLAEHMLGTAMDRVALVHGYIDDAPEGPFDAAVCLLTLHFLDREERTRTAAAIHRRLKPGGSLVAAHSSFPQEPGQRALWLDRYVAFATASGADPDQVAQAQTVLNGSPLTFTPEQDEEILYDAGFSDVQMFYAAFTWRGWTCRA